MYKLYDYLSSGNSYKVRLLLSQLGVPYERVNVDIMRGESQLPSFLAVNPLHRVPVLQLSNDEILIESNRILWFLASGTKFMPPRDLHGEVVYWFSIVQGYLDPGIARVRFWIKFLHNEPEEYGDEWNERKDLANLALTQLENALAKSEFLVGNSYSIADMAAYAYGHLAEDARVDLSVFPHVREWCCRIEETENYISIDME